MAVTGSVGTNGRASCGKGDVGVDGGYSAIHWHKPNNIYGKKPLRHYRR